MTVSKKVTLNADGSAATVANAEMSDILTTALSMDSAVTGWYGVIQKVGLVAVGAAIQNYRLGNGVNIFRSA